MSTIEWPEVNSLAWLRLACCNAEHPTRIEDVIDGNVVVGAPNLPHEDFVRPEIARDGCFMGWTMERGALEAPVALVANDGGAVPTWTLKVAGPLEETQRRAFVRLEVEIPVRMHLLGSGATTSATTVDLSEGGFKGVVDKWALDPGGREFVIELALNDQTYFIPSRMAWWGNSDMHGYRLVGVSFADIDQQTANTIRGFIFQTQLEHRRRRLA